jgi:hypothetical protein
MSAGPFLADRLITWFWPWGRKQLDNWRHRRQIFLWLIIIGVFWAGFSAWREERDQRLTAEAARDQAQRDLSSSRSTPTDQEVTRQLQRELGDAETQIKKLETTNGDLAKRMA